MSDNKIYIWWKYEHDNVKVYSGDPDIIKVLEDYEFSTFHVSYYNTKTRKTAKDFIIPSDKIDEVRELLDKVVKEKNKKRG